MWQQVNQCLRMRNTVSVYTAWVLTGLLYSSGIMAETQIIELTQTGCQFLEPEGQDYGYKPASSEDCKTINSKSADKRLANVEPLTLTPGKYIFRVTNKNVPYSLGFWLRGSGLKRVLLPSVSGGGLAKGTTKDYEIDLKAGDYVYSCPLNPTPDYPIIVTG
jgi:hypothetical protein